MLHSEIILENFRTSYSKEIDLSLRPAYRALLDKLGSPQNHLPPVFHVAGTNGKGSTCAFLRAILEAAGYIVHVYTSPHLVNFHERIRVAGHLITEEALASILEECQQHALPASVSYFEAATAAAFAAFARTPADFTIVEVGLGGRLDATNVIDHPIATIIARLSFDHREFLGNTLAEIAAEKAGIMKPGVPCFTAAQPAAESIEVLRATAVEKRISLAVGGEDWTVNETANGFSYEDQARSYDLPHPALTGRHQVDNAGLAIAALSVLKKPLLESTLIRGLTSVNWSARLQRLTDGALPNQLPDGWELWLDGGHNDSAGEVLASQAEVWHKKDQTPLYVIIGMLTTKSPEEFLERLKKHIRALVTVPIRHEPLSFAKEVLKNRVEKSIGENVSSEESLSAALRNLVSKNPRGRILICGSLYLAGEVLRENGNKLS